MQFLIPPETLPFYVGILCYCTRLFFTVDLPCLLFSTHIKVLEKQESIANF